MKVFGLLGEKLSHSLSPKIHNMIYKALDIEAAYSLFQIQPDMLKDAVQGIRALDIDGVNVTIPYKLKVMEYLDSISDEALRIGAVNTISNNENRLRGYNTDYTGFGKMLDRYSIDIKNKIAVIMGSGGAAKAVVTYMEDNKASNIHIISREPSKVISFDKNKYSLIDYSRLKQIKHADILINCTPCGMYPNTDCSPIEEAMLSSFGAVVDLIYNPSETLLIKYARKNNILAINGLYMLVAQAIASFEIWNSRKVDDIITDKIYHKLKKAFPIKNITSEYK